jgi:hypothetical protein
MLVNVEEELISVESDREVVVVIAGGGGPIEMTEVEFVIAASDAMARIELIEFPYCGPSFAPTGSNCRKAIRNKASIATITVASLRETKVTTDISVPPSN